MKQGQIISRLNRIEGQIKGLVKIFKRKSDPNEIIQQIEAVKGALTSIERLILQQNFQNLTQGKNLDSDLEQAIAYLLKK